MYRHFQDKQARNKTHDSGRSEMEWLQIFQPNWYADEVQYGCGGHLQFSVKILYLGRFKISTRNSARIL